MHSLAIDPLVRRQDGEPLDHVLQLAHIARPSVLLESLQAGVSQLGAAIVAPVVLVDKEVRQQRRVATTLAQRG